MTDMDQGQSATAVKRRSARNRALYWFGALLLAVLLADQLIAFGMRLSGDSAPILPEDPEIENRADLEFLLGRAAATSGRVLLLLGDSVLAGDVLASRSAEWSRRRVIDALRSEAHPDADVTFYQVAKNGLLPVDMQLILAALDRLDPQGHVELAVEVNLRFFSRDYREVTDCSREWLCASGAGAIRPFSFNLDFLRSHLPIWRHRLQAEGLSPIPSAAEVAQPVATAWNDALAGMARVQGHYRVDLSQRGEQLRALERIAAGLREHQRRGVFFATPLSDGFASALFDEGELGGVYAEIARVLHEAGAPQSQFVSFDHPLFEDSLFVDHVHLRALGNRLLAVNLLAEFGVRLARAPHPSELLYDHAIERTLVSSGDRGHVNGPAWMARFDGVGGIAFDPNSQQLIVSEPDSHTLRRLRGEMRSVEPWAGLAGQPGSEDGPVAQARFESPHSPVVSGGSVLLIDGQGARIRSIDAGRVSTPVKASGPIFVELAASEAGLFVLDGAGAIHLIRNAALVPQVGAPEGGELPTHFTVSDAGEVFVTDGVRILRGTLPVSRAEAALLPFRSLEVVVSGGGRGIMPETGSRFPIRFDELRFTELASLRYVERYRSLLVMDFVSVDAPNFKSPATERAHLRLLQMETRQVFPWLKAYVNENAQFPAFWRAKSPGSAFHLADLALDPSTLDLYLLEKQRSRLIRIGDGIYGTSRVSDSEAAATSPFGARSSRETLAAFRPQRFRSQRVERLGMRGNTIGLLVGSSLIIAADGHGYYELGRSLELNLRRRMLLTDRILPDLFVSSIPAATIPRAVGSALEFMQLHFVPEFVVIAANELVPAMAEPIRNGTALDALLVLKRLSEKQGFVLFVMDDSVLGGRGRDGLLPRSPEFQKFLRTLEEAGIETLEPLAELIRSHLDIAPWGNVPHRENLHHGSPQAIDRTADQLASLLAPRLASRFEAIAAQRDRSPLQSDALVLEGGLRAAVLQRGAEALWNRPRIPVDASRVRLNGAVLEVLVDIGKLEARDLPISASAAGLRSVVRTFVLEDVRGRIIDELAVNFVRFASYDEYGRGSLADWQSEYEVRLTRTELNLLDE